MVIGDDFSDSIDWSEDSCLKLMKLSRDSGLSGQLHWGVEVELVGSVWFEDEDEFVVEVFEDVEFDPEVELVVWLESVELFDDVEFESVAFASDEFVELLLEPEDPDVSVLFPEESL